MLSINQIEFVIESFPESYSLPSYLLSSFFFDVMNGIASSFFLCLLSFKLAVTLPNAWMTTTNLLGNIAESIAPYNNKQTNRKFPVTINNGEFITEKMTWWMALQVVAENISCYYSLSQTKEKYSVLQVMNTWFDFPLGMSTYFYFINFRSITRKIVY